MKELHNILTDNILNDKGITVTIDSGIPKTTIRIHQSATMILYGIGKQNEPEFTLCIFVENKSNKGNRINEALINDNVLTGFKTFSDNRSIIYVCDFKTNIDSIVTKAHEVLDGLKLFSSGKEPRLIVHIGRDMHTLK
jgi:hypothetical protein